MFKHLLSFCVNPVGYCLNAGATVAIRVLGDWEPMWMEAFFANACQRYCSRDGIQDDWWSLCP